MARGPQPPARVAGLHAASTTDGVKQTTLKKKMSHGVELLPPPNQFFPIVVYRRRFGSPSKAENKKRKHKESVVNGVHGVVIPGHRTAVS